MGGLSGEVRGRSKGETYAKYLEEVLAAQEVFGDIKPDANYKKWCKSRMKQDLETGEWVLSFHFHT